MSKKVTRSGKPELLGEIITRQQHTVKIKPPWRGQDFFLEGESNLIICDSRLRACSPGGKWVLGLWNGVSCITGRHLEKNVKILVNLFLTVSNTWQFNSIDLSPYYVFVALCIVVIVVSLIIDKDSGLEWKYWMFSRIFCCWLSRTWP